jgi:hypothetical protein
VPPRPPGPAGLAGRALCGRALPANDPAAVVEQSIVGARNRYKAHLTQRAGADEIARRFPAHWGTVTPSRPTPASTAPATTISAGWRCESPCSASTSRCTSHPSCRASTSAPRRLEPGHGGLRRARRWARQGQAERAGAPARRSQITSAVVCVVVPLHGRLAACSPTGITAHLQGSCEREPRPGEHCRHTGRPLAGGASSVSSLFTFRPRRPVTACARD